MTKKTLSTGVKAQMIIWALFMPVCLIVAVWAFLPKASKDDDISKMLVDSQVMRTEPVGKVEVPKAKGEGSEAAEEVAAAAPPPKETYDTICAACHATGLLDSPKFGDSAAWEKRIADVGGFDKLVASAIAGKGAMPPKGGATLNDADFSKVVGYISGQAK